MLKGLIISMAALVIVFGASAIGMSSASASAHSSHSVVYIQAVNVPGTLCVAPYDINYASGATGWTQMDWEGQTCGYTMYVRTHCQNIYTLAKRWVYSGKVSGNEIEDRATCSNSELAFGGAWQYEYSPGLWTVWMQIWGH